MGRTFGSGLGGLESSQSSWGLATPCVDTVMLAPGLGNLVLAQHFVLGVFATLFADFGSLLKKLLCQTVAAFAAPGLPNLCWLRNVGSWASKRCADAAFRARGVRHPFLRFR